MWTPTSPHHLMQWRYRHPCFHTISLSGGQSVQTPMSPHHLTQWRSVSADTHVPTPSHAVEVSHCRRVPTSSHAVEVSQLDTHVSTSSHTVEVSQCRHPCLHVISRGGQSVQTLMSPRHLMQWRSVSADTHVSTSSHAVEASQC